MLEKEKQYRKYIYNHRKNVKKVWNALDKHLVGENWLCDFKWFKIDKLIKNHDKSKYSYGEFYGYRQWFYNDLSKSYEKHQGYYDDAWNAHQKNNKHHWQYWVLICDSGEIKILDMPFVYVIELLCDWTAMSLFYNNLPSDWFDKNKHKMMLHDGTLSAINLWLPLFDNVYLEVKEAVK